jgi:hypothetical protein
MPQPPIGLPSIGSSGVYNDTLGTANNIVTPPMIVDPNTGVMAPPNGLPTAQVPYGPQPYNPNAAGALNYPGIYGYDPSAFAGMAPQVGGVDYAAMLDNPEIGKQFPMTGGTVDESFAAFNNLTNFLNGYENQVKSAFGDLNSDPSGFSPANKAILKSISNDMKGYQGNFAQLQQQSQIDAAKAQGAANVSSQSIDKLALLFEQYIRLSAAKEGIQLNSFNSAASGAIDTVDPAIT